MNKYGGSNWKKVSDLLVQRNGVQCKQRWAKVLRPGLVKGAWAVEVRAVCQSYSPPAFQSNISVSVVFYSGRYEIDGVGGPVRHKELVLHIQTALGQNGQAMQRTVESEPDHFNFCYMSSCNYVC